MVSPALFQPIITPQIDPALLGFITELVTYTDEMLLARGGYDAAKKVLDDAYVATCQEQLANAICKDEIEVIPGDDTRLGKKLAALVEDAVTRVNWEQLTPQLLNYRIIGWGACQLYWMPSGEYITLDTSTIKTETGAAWSKPGIGALDSEWVEFDLWGNPRFRSWRSLPYGLVIPDEQQWTIRYKPRSQYDWYGRGLWRYLTWILQFWRNNTVNWVNAGDFGGSVPLVSYPPGLPDTDPAVLAAQKIAQDIKLGKGIAKSADTLVELLQSARSASVDYQAFAAECRQLVSLLLLGQLGSTTELRGTGAQAAEHEQVGGYTRQSVSDWIFGSFTRDVVPLFQRLNPQFANTKPPEVWRRVKQKDNPLELAQVWSTLTPVGYRPSPDLVKAKLGDGYIDLQPPVDPNAIAPMPPLSATLGTGELPMLTDYIVNAPSKGIEWAAAIAYLQSVTGRSAEECEKWLPRYELGEPTPTETTVTPDPMPPDVVPSSFSAV